MLDYPLLSGKLLKDEKSGKDKSGIDGSEREGIAGIAGIMSRADLVMLSIRLGALSSALAMLPAAISATIAKSIFIPVSFFSFSAAKRIGR
jgi:hypothetical protein